MKSSSELFPVSLLRADTLGKLTEDVYLVKHNLDSDKSVEIAVSHLMLADTPATRGSVVLVHGSFSNRGFWLSAKGEGLARLLVEQGFDVWLMEHRGHGNSPRNQDYLNNSVERYVLYDVQAVNAFVSEKSGSLPVWIGHSLGGVMVASAIASGVLNASNCRGQVLLGTQVVHSPTYLKFPLVGNYIKFRAQRKGEIIGRSIGLGPENEPAGIITEFVDLYKIFGGWRFLRTQQRLLPAWSGAQTVPLLALIGMADKTDKASACIEFAERYGGPKELLVLGRKYAFARDYGHVDMVVSKDAAQEVWPKISEFLQRLN